MKLSRKILSRLQWGRIEQGLASNWFNPLYTIYLNLRSFPLKQAIRFPIFVYGHPRFYCLSGDMRIIGKVRAGMIRFNRVIPGAPSLMSVQSEINNHGHIIFRGEGYIGTGTKITVAANKTLDIGKHVKIADLCNIGVFCDITIGEQSRIAHRSQILDSNYHYIANFTKRSVPKYDKPIAIGKGCWICNSTTVTGGAILPDYTIVASNSLINRDYSEIPISSIIGGIPAKFIVSGFRRVENPLVIKRIATFYKEHPNELFLIPEEETPDLYSELS